MKITTNFDREKGIFMFPDIVVAYRHKDRELTFVFIFACWSFVIEFDFK